MSAEVGAAMARLLSLPDQVSRLEQRLEDFIAESRRRAETVPANLVPAEEVLLRYPHVFRSKSALYRALRSNRLKHVRVGRRIFVDPAALAPGPSDDEIAAMAGRARLGVAEAGR